MWQFTRSTGKHYMTVSYAIDERRDPIISTRAAARLLKRNFKKFRNWPMAITAYNHGVSGMLRAQRRKGDYETIFKEYRSRIFKFASRNFYSEFLAAREVAHDYQKYFGKLILDAPVQTEEVVLAGYGSLPEISRHLNLNLAELHDLNPARLKFVTDRAELGGARAIDVGCGGGILAEGLAAAGVASAQLSLEGPTAEIHDDFRACPGAFEGTLRGAETLKRNGINSIAIKQGG